MARLSPRRWLGVVVLPFMGFGFLWWADRQAANMGKLFGSTFESPGSWEILGWLLTMIASGVVFGLAAGLAGADSGRATAGAILVAGIIPIAIVVYYFGVWGLGWLPIYLNVLTVFLITPTTVTVSSVAVGLVTVGLIGRMTKRW